MMQIPALPRYSENSESSYNSMIVHYSTIVCSIIVYYRYNSTDSTVVQYNINSGIIVLKVMIVMFSCCSSYSAVI